MTDGSTAVDEDVSIEPVDADGCSRMGCRGGADTTYYRVTVPGGRTRVLCSNHLATFIRSER